MFLFFSCVILVSHRVKRSANFVLNARTCTLFFVPSSLSLNFVDLCQKLCYLQFTIYALDFNLVLSKDVLTVKRRKRSWIMKKSFQVRNALDFQVRRVVSKILERARESTMGQAFPYSPHHPLLRRLILFSLQFYARRRTRAELSSITSRCSRKEPVLHLRALTWTGLKWAAEIEPGSPGSESENKSLFGNTCYAG